jgi:PAS domain S-box-containing protein
MPERISRTFTGAVGWSIGAVAARLRRSREETTAQSEWRLALMQLSSDALLTADVSGCVDAMNQEAERLTGWLAREAVGRSAADIVRLVEESSGAPIEPLSAQTLEGSEDKRPVSLIARGGQLHPVLHSAVVVRDREGETLGHVLMLRDLTVRRAQEAQREEDAQRGDRQRRVFSTLVDASDAAMFAASLDGRIVVWSTGASGLLGYTREEALGQPAGALVLPEDRSSHEGSVARVARGEPVEPCAAVLVTKDGQHVDVRLTLRAIRDQSGAITGVATIAEDARREHALQEALYSAERRQSECLTVLATELRNPLAAIWYSATSVQRASASDDDRRWAAEVIERQSKHMARLIDDLLDASQMSRHSLELRCADVTLQSVVDMALENSRPLVAANDQTVTTTIPAEAIMVHADLPRLAQALSNIVSNASRCSPRGSRVRLTVTREDAEVAIAVDDEGIGIPSERLPEIFEMFSHSTHGFDRAQGGLGIGLSLAKGLTELHGGRVTASSPGFGRGSCFEMRLPVSTTPPASTPQGSRPRHEPLCRRILIADDNRDAADGLARVLRGLGHEVLTTHDGIEALDAVEAFRPDAVLLDLGMPRMDGFEAARQLRAGPRGNGILVIALSGWGHERERQQTHAAGFDAHFVKPLDPALLQSLLHTRE